MASHGALPACAVEDACVRLDAAAGAAVLPPVLVVVGAPTTDVVASGATAARGRRSGGADRTRQEILKNVVDQIDNSMAFAG